MLCGRPPWPAARRRLHLARVSRATMSLQAHRTAAATSTAPSRPCRTRANVCARHTQARFKCDPVSDVRARGCERGTWGARETAIVCPAITVADGNATWPASSVSVTTIQGTCLPGYIGTPTRLCSGTTTSPGVWGAVITGCTGTTATGRVPKTHGIAMGQDNDRVCLGVQGSLTRLVRRLWCAVCSRPVQRDR